MIETLILIEGRNVTKDSLRSLSLSNAKQLVVGDAPGFGVILHLAATTLNDVNAAMLDFSKIEGVSGTTVLMLRS
ncbi:hypothetical protein J0A67_03010 [Algoriphagus aestuariicola]|jgi:hypothetical protein|uniref:Uncharacterized protein n=1 Tax=Algoriphagus aestuariicola TaxID=1852016 RepID=A0ABS3BKH6_9BACT|nr:hypothetical protein [Algoriphagus aestuariicola]MBN7799810.1 hypothetical protein [Algoriphagus aestuariicola]